MAELRRLAVLSPVYPTKQDSTKGAPIWAKLRCFPSNLDFTVYCSLPWRADWMRKLVPPRSYQRYPMPVDESAAAFRSIPLRYFSLPGVGRYSNGVALASALTARLAEHPPQAILAYHAYPDGYAAVRAARCLGVPAVIGAQGSDLKRVASHGPVRWQTMIAMREADAVFGVSQDLVNCAVALGASPDRVYLVRTGIDRTVFHRRNQQDARREIHFAERGRLIVFVGNLLPVKGIPILIEALSILNRDGGEPVRLGVIGEGNLGPSLRLQAASLGLEETVTLLGAKSPSEVMQWLNAADLLCLPSHSEGLPNVVLESLSCGCPVVATAVGGTPELVDSGCGLLTPPNQPQLLAGALREGLNRQWDREGIAGRPIDSWTQVAERTLEICRKALDSPRPIR